MNYFCSCRKEPPVQDPMTPKAWKAPCWTGSCLMENLLTPQLLAMSSLTAVTITRRLDFCCVRWSLIGLTMSSSLLLCKVVSMYGWHFLIRVKAKLRSGDYIVPGDQWPNLLYKDYNYDPEDPWRGFLRSTILISVRLTIQLPVTDFRIR